MIVERLRKDGSTICRRAADEIERLVAQVASDDEHYRAAMAMSEKHRKLWVEASQSLAAIANSMKRDWIDPAEHANWCIERAKRQHTIAEAADEIERLLAECEAWRECALYDPKMEGPKFKGWDRSALDRCRTRYIELRSSHD